MSVDREEVERIGRLAKLRLTDDEAERLTDEMNRILEHAERLRGLEEADVAGPTDPGGPRPSGTRSAAAESPDPLHRSPSAFAPDVRQGFFVVPPPPGVVAAEDGAGADGTEDGALEGAGGGGEARAEDAGGREG